MKNEEWGRNLKFHETLKEIKVLIQVLIATRYFADGRYNKVVELSGVANGVCTHAGFNAKFNDWKPVDSSLIQSIIKYFIRSLTFINEILVKFALIYAFCHGAQHLNSFLQLPLEQKKPDIDLKKLWQKIHAGSFIVVRRHFFQRLLSLFFAPLFN